MNVISRGIRNAFRNSVRTFSIVIILALSIGLAITMLIARQAVTTKINSVKSAIGNTINIAPAGARGFDGGGEPLTSTQLDKVKGVTHVVSITETLRDRLASDKTSLVSAIEAGSLGRRNNPGGGGGASVQTDGPSGRSFTPPVFVIGASSLKDSVLDGGGTIKLTDGAEFDPTKDTNVGLVGKTLAEKNSLRVGSTFTAYGTDITVAGIYDSGNTFSNNTVVMPLATVQRLSQQPGQVSAATVQVDSISNLATTATAIKSTLGESVADVTSQQDSSAQALAPLENIKSISLYSLIGSVAAGAAIILLTMMMIVRERRREIGVLKAIGASNVKVVAQFMTEAVTFTVLAAVVGLGIGVVAASPVTQVMVSSSSNSAQGAGPVTSSAPGGGPVMVRGGGRAFASAAGLGGQNLRTIQTAVGWNIALYGLLAALVIAIVGSAVPAWLIAKVRPAEVMRTE